MLDFPKPCKSMKEDDFPFGLDIVIRNVIEPMSPIFEMAVRDEGGAFVQALLDSPASEGRHAFIHRMALQRRENGDAFLETDTPVCLFREIRSLPAPFFRVHNPPNRRTSIRSGLYRATTRAKRSSAVINGIFFSAASARYRQS